MWNTVKEQVEGRGGVVRLNTQVAGIRIKGKCIDKRARRE